MDPLLKSRDEIMDANWSEAVRGTLRVLGLMLEQGAITELDDARATTLVEKSLRKEIVAPGRACGARDHFLERVRVLYKDRFPINTGGLTISITRDDALQDVLAKAVDLTLRTYIARHPDDPDNNLLRAGAFAVDFSGDVLAEVDNVNFKELKYDIMASGWRQPGSTCKVFTYGALVERLRKQVLGEKPSVENAQDLVSQVLERCSVLDAPFFVSLGRGRGQKTIENFHSRSEPQYRGEITCRIALGESRNTAAMRAGANAGIKNVIDLRSGVIPGMDPLGDAIWKLKPGERKKLTLAFPLDKAGELAGKAGTATNHDGKTSDVWLMLFVPGKPDRPDTGILLGFWMGKDAKERPLGDRGSTGGPDSPSPVHAIGCIPRRRSSRFSRRSGDCCSRDSSFSR